MNNRALSSWPLLALLGAACTGELRDGVILPGTPPGPAVPPLSSDAGAAQNGQAPRSDAAGTMTPPPVSFPSLSCTQPMPGPPGPRRLWRLNPRQYRNTVATFLNGRGLVRNAGSVPKWLLSPFDAVEASDRFTNQAASYAMTDFELRRSVATAHEIATRFITVQRATAGNCLQAPASPAAWSTCLATLIEQRGPFLFHRPLAPDEVARYVRIAEQAHATLGADQAAALAFEAMLVSPQFLYRAEVGTPAANATTVRLSPYETAAAIALTLTDWPADTLLWKAAAANELSTADQIAPHVLRLLGKLDNAAPVEQFVREYFRYEKVLDIFKDAKGHDPAMLLRDSDAFVKAAVAANGRIKFLETLLTADWTYINRFTSLNWGVPSFSYTPVRADLPAGQRAGLLTHPSFLVAFSEMDHTLPVQRGRFISESLLCRAVPDLPIGQVPPLPDLGPNATMRDKLAIHSKTPGCEACHRLMDPLGLPFEQYDDLGRFRTDDHGKPVNTTGALAGAGDVDGPVATPLELATKLARSPVVEACFVRHSFRYWMGRAETEDDACVIEQMVNAYRSGGGDYVAMLQALVTSRAFLERSVR